MPEPITDANRADATAALLRSATFYRGLVNEVIERDPELMAKIMGDGNGDDRWAAAGLCDEAIKAWTDFINSGTFKIRSLTDEQLLAALLAAVMDTHPLTRTPALPFQVSVVASGVVLLWDAREDANDGIASAIASQHGKVTATAASPLVGVLVRSDKAEESAAMLSATYPVATGLAGDGEHPF